MTAAPIAPITDEALAEVVRLAEAATEGRSWKVQPGRRDEWEVPFEPVTDGDGNVIAHAYGYYAAFIAAANPATVLAMGARIAKAEARVEQLTDDRARALAAIDDVREEAQAWALTAAQNAGHTRDLAVKYEALEAERDRLRAALEGLAVFEEFDMPGDRPESCGLVCHLCSAQIELADKTGHEPGCLLARAALNTSEDN